MRAETISRVCHWLPGTRNRLYGLESSLVLPQKNKAPFVIVTLGMCDILYPQDYSCLYLDFHIPWDSQITG